MLAIDKLTSLWNELFPIRYLLTLENSLDKENAFFESMSKLGLTREGFTIIRSKKIDGSFFQVCDDIYRTHHQVTLDSLNKNPGKNIAIFEDDCRPTSDEDNIKRLIECFEYIKSLPSKDWQILNLGQTAAGPVFPIKDKPIIVKTSIPIAAQSYIINGYYVKEMIEYCPENNWKFPWNVEAFITIPLYRKLAIYPNVTQQIVVPRIQKFFPIMKDMTYDQVATKLNNVMHYAHWIALSGIVLATVCKLVRK